MYCTLKQILFAVINPAVHTFELWTYALKYNKLLNQSLQAPLSYDCSVWATARKGRFSH